MDEPEGVQGREIGEVKAEIAGIAAEHGDRYHIHEESMSVHHQHKADADDEHLKTVSDKLGDIAGVESVTQSEHGPTDEGYEFVDPKDHQGAQDSEVQHGADNPGNVIGSEKAIKTLVRHMSPFLLQQYVKELKKGLATKDVQDCVQHKIPKLLAEGHGQQQAEAIAYAMCGEKKAIDTGSAGGDTGETAGGANPSEDSADEKKPHGLFTLIFRKFPDGWKIIHDHSAGE